MFHTINLEMSLKPFKQTDDAFIRQVCRELFTQWRPLLKGRKTVSLMLWTGDGSEILEYAGDLEQSFEWSCYIGTANKPLLSDDESPALSLHSRKQYYIERPPVMTYATLKRIVAAIKEEGSRLFPDICIQVGETFDIGPEFAVSDFKYRRHPEICSGKQLDALGFVDATALLHGDSRRYAAYPDGIPEGTPFGTFLGAQANIFLQDMGFDYLWLSNGLGFSAQPWDPIGKVFDGERFHPEQLVPTKEQVFRFWKQFREMCPDIPLMTRGTNHSVGIDYATDAVPLYDLYTAGLDITPPPNSPWAALNDDFGLELMGHMTRICELPGEDFLFRYYLHDPWWVNSPWYDRYNGYPHDVYLPMAVSRIDRQGNVRTAERLNILSIDNSFGDMPDNCVNEVLPHLLKAEHEAADAPSPLVWVYPMREYTAAQSEEVLREMYEGDRYIADAINHGLPLNCVASTDTFCGTPVSLYTNSVLISPPPISQVVAEKLRIFTEQGGRVIYYSNKKRASLLPEGAPWVDTASAPCALREALEQYSISIRFVCKPHAQKPAAMTVHRYNNALLFSVYNPHATTETMLRFPLGAPILLGGEAELRDGYACYHFAKSEYRECRVFVQQADGIVTVKEEATVSGKYRRRIFIGGLEDATVCVFPETYCADTAVCSFCPPDYNTTPRLDDRWKFVQDENGSYLRAEHISGDYYLLMPSKNRYVG